MTTKISAQPMARGRSRLVMRGYGRLPVTAATKSTKVNKPDADPNGASPAMKVLMLLLAALIGAASGLMLFVLSAPDDSDIDAAVRELVAPGALVKEDSAGRPGPRFGPLFDYRGPYEHSIVAVSTAGSFDARLAESEAELSDSNWVESSRQEQPNGVSISAAKDGLLAEVTVLRSVDTSFVTVTSETRSGWWSLIAVILGAALAVAAVLGSILIGSMV